MSNDDGFDWDADFQRHLPDITVRELEIEKAHYSHPALDEMIERMLTSPERVGIAIIIDQRVAEGDDIDGVRVTSERHLRLDPHVPFGKVWEFPSMIAYEIWIERGCPGPV